jgi:hypothetical protein
MDLDPVKETTRFSDERLNQFYFEFQQHCREERTVKVQAEEMYAAMFRKQDHELGSPPGILQSLSMISERLHAMEEMQTRHKTFIAGVAFAASAVWIFLTDIGVKLLALIQHK